LSAPGAAAIREAEHAARLKASLASLTWHSEQALGFRFGAGQEEWKAQVAADIVDRMEKEGEK